MINKMSVKLPSVVFVVAVGEKHGIGHLKRCVNIAKMGEKSFNSYFYLIGDVDYKGIKGIVKFPIINEKDFKSISLSNKNIKAFVTDCRDTNKKFMMELIKIAPVVSIDDIGKGSRYAVTKILSLPTLKRVEANYKGLKYLFLDPSIIEIKRRIAENKNTAKEGILVSFGGSDPYNLTLEIATILSKAGLKTKVIRGPLYRSDSGDLLESLNIDIIENPENLLSLIAESELLITSFGITMFEALYLGTPVILYNHSKYHYRLSLKYDLPNLAYPGYFRKSDLERILLDNIKNKESLIKRSDRYGKIIDAKASERIVGIIKGIIDNGRKDCLFHHSDYRVIFRKEGYSISECLKCGDLFLTRMQDNKDKYVKDYFLDEYKKQYGKSYDEDKENIQKFGNARLDKIERLKPERGKLLDIGCAMGFFVELASNRGWISEGIEVSEYASEWARNHLGVNVTTGNFLDYNFKSENYDAITMFFVLEHFSNIEDVIAKVYSMLKKGGVLALALPNRGGISYRLNRKLFLNIHPDDHFFDTNIKNISRFLALNGLYVRDIRITGIHPERFFSKIGIKNPQGILKKYYSFIANAFRLGDTFELYAVKK